MEEDGMKSGSRISKESVIDRAVAEGILSEETPCVLFIDLECLGSRVRSLKRAFPDSVHSFAVKALPVPGVLRKLTGQGLGLEVASAGEIAIAKHLGVDPGLVVFDSPAKTRGEISEALDWGCRLNVDNFQELRRVASVVGRKDGGVGLRVCPDLSGDCDTCHLHGRKACEVRCVVDAVWEGDQRGIPEVSMAHWASRPHRIPRMPSRTYGEGSSKNCEARRRAGVRGS